jgi:hypothetical protein
MPGDPAVDRPRRIIVAALVVVANRRRKRGAVAHLQATHERGPDVTALLRGRDVSGLPVVDISTGEDVAEIPRHHLRAERGGVGGSRWPAGLLGRLRTSAVERSGPSAPRPDIDAADALTTPPSWPTSTRPGGRRRRHVNDVLTESGRNLGQVRERRVSGGRRPRVVGFEIGGGAVGTASCPSTPSAAVSRSTLIVPDSFENRVRTDLVGLAGEVTELEGGS